MTAIPRWRIAVIGAGAIGSTLALRLASAGHDVTLVIRNDQRRNQINTEGLIGKSANGAAERASVRHTTALDRDYDLLIVPVQRQQLDALIPVLAANGSARILLALNNATDTYTIDELLGAERIVWGFPAIVARLQGDAVEYNIVPGYVQKTTLGRSDGRITDDLRTIKAIFDGSGVPSVITAQIDGWLKTHAAMVSPMVAAAFLPKRSGFGPLLGWSAAHRLASGIQTGLSAVKGTGAAVTPAPLRTLALLPTVALTATIVAGFSAPPAKNLVTDVSGSVAAESALLLRQLAVLARKAGIDPTPLADLATALPDTKDH